MSQVHNISPILSAIDTATGLPVTPDENGDVTLPVGSYVFMLTGTKDVPLQSVHIMTDATIALSAGYIETCNLPRNTMKTGTPRPDQVTDYSTTVGHWIKENPTSAYVASTGTGWTIAFASITTKTAGAGGCMYHIGNMGAGRSRLFVTVSTQGKMRVAGYGKA